MSNNRNWKSRLQAILNQHNHRHGKRNKGVSHSTQAARAAGLFRCLDLLRRLGLDPDPEHLRGKHVRLLMQYWTADPAIAPLCAQRNVAMRDQPYSAAYIQQQLSFLRVFATWIGKPGMVLPPQRYVSDSALVARRYSAQHDKSWSGHGLDIDQVIASVAQIDERVAAQLCLMRHFGLRRKEAVMFCPHAAIVPAHAIPASQPVSATYLAFLKVKRGTKGGRLRFTAVRTDAQRQALDWARSLARFPTSHLGHPDLTLKQALDRFDNVVRKAGISRKRLGVTPHGLRHQFAGDLYVELTALPPPVRGGDIETDPGVMHAAYLEVARQLGHNRPQISGAYLGSAARSGTAPPAALPDDAP